MAARTPAHRVTPRVSGWCVRPPAPPVVVVWSFGGEQTAMLSSENPGFLSQGGTSPTGRALKWCSWARNRGDATYVSAGSRNLQKPLKIQ